jgi:sulfite reductase (NADPH) flavoprotein alpha-component
MKFVHALLVLSVYGAFCAFIVWRHRRRLHATAHRAQALQSAAPGQALWWVVHASQTGQAEALAEQTAQALHSAGLAVRLLPLGQLRREDLGSIEHLLCIVSTYGEGDAPDSAAVFARDVMGAQEVVGEQGERPLQALKVGMLALGDATYSQYCGFGRALDAWFQARGAQTLFERIEADCMAPAAMQAWRERLSELTGAQDLPDWETPPLQACTLRARRHMNPGSAGGPVYHLEFMPESGAWAGEPPAWEAGDLAQIEIPAVPGEPRDYSIASVPADGALHLLVRQTRRTDGSPGLASGWLTAATAQGLPLQGRVMLRLRAHSGFRIAANVSRPLILIGNGTGLAGLRAHIRGRVQASEASAKETRTGAAPAPMWLIFGERHTATDAYYREELEAWVAQGLLRVDWVFSREQSAAQVGQRRYVQHALREAAADLRDWVAGRQGRPGAAIYVCGSLQGMAAEVDQALRDILGEADLRALADEGRYRRDVY